MKRVIIIHGWEGDSQGHWKPWLGKELEKHDFSVTIPDLSNPDDPKQKVWLKELNEIIGEPDEDLYLVGHSLACMLILKYLERLPEGKKIGGAVLVAGFVNHLDIEPLKDFYKEELDWEEAKKHCDKFVAIHSDNDQYVPLEHGHIFEEKLGAKFIFEPGKGHFMEEEGITELPSALDSILEIAK